MRKVEQSKSEVLLSFAKRVPNYCSASWDTGRDVLSVWVDNIHAVEYRASEVLSQFEARAAAQGYAVQWVA